MNNKYITIEEGEDYRTIAAKMTKLGYKMNHATARNILLSGMRNFMQNLAEELGQTLSDAECKQLVMRQDLHEVLGDILPLCANSTEEQSICQVANQP